MGCLFAARLSEAGASCQLVLKNPNTDTSCEVSVEDTSGTRHFKLAASANEDRAPIRKLLLTTKAYDVEAALRSVRHRLATESQVLILVNGMGLLEIAKSLLPKAKLFAGTTTEGAWRTGARSIRHAGTGVTRIGCADSAEAAPWFEEWNRSALECYWDPNIESALWHKLAINCAINPLTALHRCHNGKLDDSQSLRSLVLGLCDEIAAVSDAAGYQDTAQDIHRDAIRVIRGTARNRSSMLQDREAGRRTEIDFITGYLIKRAEDLAVPAPRNQELLERIRNLYD